MLSCISLANTNLINLNVNTNNDFTPIYKCPIRPIETTVVDKANTLIDSSVLIFKNASLASLLDKGEETLIISNQVNILHKVDYHHTFNNEYTFAYGHMASLELILKETQTYAITNQTAKFNTKGGEEDESEDEEIKEETIDQLKSSTFDIEKHYFNPNNNSNNKIMFKCNGKKATNGLNTHYLILKQDEHQELLKKLKVNQVFFGDDANISYMEMIQSIEDFDMRNENV